MRARVRSPLFVRVPSTRVHEWSDRTTSRRWSTLRRSPNQIPRRGSRPIGRDRSQLEHLAGIGIGSERAVESQQFQPNCPGPLFGEQRAKSFTF
jgi:hypothetical protein